MSPGHLPGGSPCSPKTLLPTHRGSSKPSPPRHIPPPKMSRVPTHTSPAPHTHGIHHVDVIHKIPLSQVDGELRGGMGGVRDAQSSPPGSHGRIRAGRAPGGCPGVPLSGHHPLGSITPMVPTWHPIPAAPKSQPPPLPAPVSGKAWTSPNVPRPGGIWRHLAFGDIWVKVKPQLGPHGLSPTAPPSRLSPDGETEAWDTDA